MSELVAVREVAAKLGGVDAGESFGDFVARDRSRSEVVSAGVERVLQERTVHEIRLRILHVRERDTDRPSFRGIVEGFPGIFVHASTVGRWKGPRERAKERLSRLMDHGATRMQLDDLPTVRKSRLVLGFKQG